MSEIMQLSSALSLSELLRTVLQERGLSNSALAEKVGISEGTVRNLLKQGSGEEPAKPHPLVLRGIAEALDLDQVQLFQLAGYIAPGYEPSMLSAGAQYVGLCFDALPSDKQQLLIRLMHSMMETSGLTPAHEHLQQLLAQVSELQKEHRMFRQRRFGIRDEFGRVAGNVTRTTTPKLLLKMVCDRLVGLFQDEPTVVITRKHIQQVIDHPDGMVILNALLPRKAVPTGLEKLYWLLFSADSAKPEDRLSELQRAGYKALWRLLEQVAR